MIFVIANIKNVNDDWYVECVYMTLIVTMKKKLYFSFAAHESKNKTIL